MKEILRFIRPRSKKVLIVLLIIGVWLAVAKEVGFVLFMIEESLQMNTFALWQAKTSHTKQVILRVYRRNLDLAWTVLYSVGWINPLAFMSYRSFFTSSEMFYAAASEP